MSRRLYDSLTEALADSDAFVPFPDGGCSCSLGPCSRLSRAPDAKDMYEPDEPALARAGLPWFYFVREELLTRRHRRQFRREARALWGDAAISDDLSKKP